ncbi:MAG: SPASM domain-containing protein [Oscillospiraceae bacterium]|nr:SPASM domain-containing protein [Oscillospiraceae bacterium]
MFKRVYVEITNVCNLSCSFCPGTGRPARFLAPAEFRILAERLRGHTEYLYLHVMGEPLLHPQLEELLAIARELGFRVCVTTNGTLLPRRGQALSGVHKVSVSLHSFEGNDCPGSMEEYLSGVWDFCRRASAEGTLCALRLWNIGGRDNCNGQVLAFLGEQLGRDVLSIPTDRRGNRRLSANVFLEQAEKFDWPDPEAPESGTEFCHGLRQQLAVLCDGTAVPCCLDGEGRMALGNLFDQPVEEILASPRAAAIREGFSRRRPAEELCRRCGYAARF